LKVFLGDFFAPAKKLPALMRGSSALKDQKQSHWIPAYAGMTSVEQGLDSSLTSSAVVRLFAGMTSQGKSENAKSLDFGFVGITS
jgi:hypothetical protein